MTYCIGWKQDDKVYIIADTAISSFNSEDLITPTSSFGEKHDVYGKHVVEEKDLKIIRLSKGAIATYAGIQKPAIEALEYLKMLIDNGIINALEVLEQNYSSSNQEFELLIALKDSDQNNKLFYFNNKKGFYEINDYKEIGSGALIPSISEPIISFIKSRQRWNENADKYLATIVSYTQCFSIKNHLISHGIGGAFFGAYLDKEIVWCRDLLYLFYAKNIDDSEKSIVSVIGRFDGIFSASGFDGLNKYFLNIGTDGDIIGNKYKENAIAKILNYGQPDYFIFYSPYNNDIYFIETNRRVYNSCIYMYVKRNIEDNNYAFLFDPTFTEMVNFKKNIDILPSFQEVKVFPRKYITREEHIKFNKLEEKVTDINEIYDLDLRELYTKLKFEIDEQLGAFFKSFNFFIIIDVEYLFNKIKELHIYYDGLEIDLNEMELEQMVYSYIQKIDNIEFEKYGIILMTMKGKKYIYNGFDLIKWLKTYQNHYFVYFGEKNFEESYSSFAFEYFKNFYNSESYFHILRNYIMADNSYINSILRVTPRINTTSSYIPDFYIIRNHNSETVIDGNYHYINIDDLIGYMFSLTSNEMALWDPEKKQFSI